MHLGPVWLAPLALAALLGTSACSGGTGPGGPDGPDGAALLRVSAGETGSASDAVAPAAFKLEDVTSYRIRISDGPRVVVDSRFVKRGAIRHEFRVAPDTYVVVVEAFAAREVLVLEGLGEANVAQGDTADVAVELDPALEPSGVVLTIGEGDPAVVPTNGTAPVRVQVVNVRGQAVPGARVSLGLDPADAGEIRFAGAPETGPDGILTATFVPARRESRGEVHLALDGIPIAFPAPKRFSIVSPVDANRSTLILTNNFRLPADGVSKANIRVRIVDAEGIPQAGIPVVIRSSRNGPGEILDMIVSDQSATNAAGEVHATLTTSSSSNLAGDAQITVEAEGKRLAQTGTVNFLSIVSAVATTITVEPAIVPADGASAAEVRVEVRSVAGRPVPNALVHLETKNNLLFEIQPVEGRADGNGVFRSRISSTVATGTVLDVIADGIQTSATGFVLFN